MTSGEKTTIIVAVIGLLSAVAVALVSNADKILGGSQPQPQPQPKPQPAPQPQQQSAPQPQPPVPAKPASATEAVAAMQWIESRCGPGIEFVVASPPGATIDRAARSFATALGSSGVRPVPVVMNVGGALNVNGRFSIQKFDDWQRARGAKEGCLLAIVPADMRESFGKPRFDAVLDGRSYGVVLPRGVITEVSEKWSIVFVKASSDPDFLREIGKMELKVDVVPIR